MMEQDTVKLLRECDAGIKMGVASIDDVLEHVQAKNFRDRLSVCRSEHKKLEDEVQSLLRQYHDDGKEPNPIAKGMSWMKTNMKLAMDTSDAAIADLMTDGCNMGVKLLVLALGALGMANMWEAVFADVGVSVIAILNAARALKAGDEAE